LLKRKCGEQETDIARYSDSILSSCLRAAEMVDRLKLFTRKDRKAEVLVDIHPLLEELKDLLVFMLPLRYKVSWDLGAVSHWLAADTGLFQGSILHLLVLARSLLPKGGNITIRTSNFSIRIGEAQLQPALALDLVSNDEKIDQDVLSQVVSSTQQGVLESSGLHVVREYVISLGGSLDVERMGSTGVRLRMLFPLTILRDPESIVEEENATFLHEEASSFITSSEQKPWVLVIDDEPEVRAFLIEMIHSLGFRAVGFEDSESAVHWVNSGEVAYAAMVDQQLGFDDGLMLCEWLQASCPQLSLALMTGFAGDMNQRALQTRGITLFEKPFDILRIKNWLVH